MIGVTGPHGHVATVLKDWGAAQLGVDLLPIDGDILDPVLIRGQLRLYRIRTLIHTAAIVGTAACLDAGEHAIDVNVKGTWNVVQACRDFGIRLVYLSSSAVYDPKGSEDPSHRIKEGDPIAPHSIYPTTKYAGELICQNYLKGDQLMILRPGPIYGGGSDVSMISQAVRAKQRNGTITFHLNPQYLKDYFWNEDFAHLAWGLIETDQAWGQTFNVSRMMPRKFSDVLTILFSIHALPQGAYVRADEDVLMNHVPDNADARYFVTSFDPAKTVELEEGIQRTWTKLSTGR